MYPAILIVTILICLNFKNYRCDPNFSLDKAESEVQYFTRLPWLTQKKQELNQNPLCALSDSDKNQICSDVFEYSFTQPTFVSSEDTDCKKQPLILDAHHPPIVLVEEGYPCHYEIYDHKNRKSQKIWITQGDAKTIYLLSDKDSKFHIIGYLENIKIPSPAPMKNVFNTQVRKLIYAPEDPQFRLEVNRLQTEINTIHAENSSLQLQINAITEANDKILQKIGDIGRLYSNDDAHYSHYFSLDTYETELKYLADSRWFSPDRSNCERNSFCQLSDEVKLSICAKLFLVYRGLGEFRYVPTDTLQCEKQNLRLCSVSKTSDECYVFEDCAIQCNSWLNGELKPRWITHIDHKTIMLLDSDKNEARAEGYITGITIPNE